MFVCCYNYIVESLRYVKGSRNFGAEVFGTFISFYDNNRNSPSFPTTTKYYSGKELGYCHRNLFIYDNDFFHNFLKIKLLKLK